MAQKSEVSPGSHGGKKAKHVKYPERTPNGNERSQKENEQINKSHGNCSALS